MNFLKNYILKKELYATDLQYILQQTLNLNLLIYNFNLTNKFSLENYLLKNKMILELKFIF